MTDYLTVIKPTDAAVLPSDPAAQYPYPLDHFQIAAIAAIDRDENVLVTAKTGSGKTLVGEYQIAHSLRRGRRVFYTTPIKSLSNQKFHDLKVAFPEAKVGIMTGDIKFCPDADVIVMTTEILRNMLYKQGTATASLGLTASLSLDGLDAVVFDECHYINNKERGQVWEETMILLPQEVKLILLSATIARPDLFAKWVGAVRQRPISLIATTHRVVPLTHYAARFQDGELALTEIMATGASGSEVFDPNSYRKWTEAKRQDWLKEKDSKQAASGRKQEVAQAKAAAAASSHGTEMVHGVPVTTDKFRIHSFVHQLNECVAALKRKDLLPALFFVFSRAKCEEYAAAIQDPLIDSSDAAAVKHIIDYHLRNHKSLHETSQYWTIKSLLEKGIAFHHSGLLPVLKEIVEILFSKGLVKVLFATETFAVGINMPTRTVVFTDLKKYDTGGLRCLHTDEYIQMAGRAGRRGKDVRGHVLYLPAREPLSPQEMQSTLCSGMPQIQSKMTFSYEFILKTFHAGNDMWLRVIENCYWYEQQQHNIRVMQEEVVKGEQDLKKFMETTGLTPFMIADLAIKDDLEAACKGSVNAERKVHQRALDQWKNKHFGPVWAKADESWPKYKALCSTITLNQRLYEQQTAELTNPMTMLAPKLEYLRFTGFLEDDLKTLTPRGILATEVNEGHSLIMPTLVISGALKDLEPTELVALLAAFIAEKDEEAQPNMPTSALKDAYYRLDHIMMSLLKCETPQVMPNQDPKYWSLDPLMVNVAYDWLNGRPTKEICESYELFEGNLTKIVLKLSNIVEELNSLATFTADVQLLEKIAAAQPLLVRDIAVPDSLYLRI
jgi:superfamily II RNA helicase